MSRLSSFSLWSRSCIGRKAGRDAGFQTRPSRLPGAHLPASLKGFGGAALHLLISSPEAAWGTVEGGRREEPRSSRLCHCRWPWELTSLSFRLLAFKKPGSDDACLAELSKFA